MTDLVYDHISMGVDMILTAAILAAVVTLLRSAVVLSSYQANIAANSDRMNYYKQYNMYDNTDTLCSADVLSALVYYRYDLSIVVNGADGVTIISNNPSTGKFYRHEGGAAIECTVQEMSIILTAERTYSSKLFEDLIDVTTGTPYEHYQGGLVTGIKFTMLPVTH